jgi:hypothetical protein
MRPVRILGEFQRPSAGEPGSGFSDGTLSGDETRVNLWQIRAEEMMNES